MNAKHCIIAAIAAITLPVAGQASTAEAATARGEQQPYAASVSPACSGMTLVTMRNNTRRAVGFDHGIAGGEFSVTEVKSHGVASIILPAEPGATVLVNPPADGPTLASATVPGCDFITGDMVINHRNRKGFVRLVNTSPAGSPAQRVRFLLIKGRSTTALPPLVTNPGERRTFGFEGMLFPKGTTVKVSLSSGPILDYAR